MLRTLGALAFVSAVLLGGCKKASPLIGKWTSTVRGTPVQIEFKPDGTMVTDTKRGPLDVVVTQSYAINGDKVTFTAKDIEITGVPPGREAQVSALKQSQIGKSDTETVAFVSDDQVTLTGKSALTLTRIKG